MATTVTKTIKSAAGDYTTVALWEADTDNDLVTADEIQVGEIYDVNPTAALTIAGATTDATRYRELTVNSAFRHAGVWDTGKMNWTGTSKPLTLGETFARAEYLQIKNTHATAGNGEILITANNCLVGQCILWMTQDDGLDGNAGVTWSAVTGVTVRNTVSYNNRHGISITNAGGTGASIENCALVANTNSGMFTATGAAPVVKNTYLGGNAVRDLSTSGNPDVDWTITTSMASDANSSETGLTNSIAWDTTNFTNVTAGSIDIHLVTGSDLIDAGTDLSGTFTIDINGATRSGTWDVGPDEFVAAAGGDNRIFWPANLDGIGSGGPFPGHRVQ